MIIDCYTSLGPSLANHDDQLLRPLSDATSAEALLAVMDRVGTDRAVVFAPRWLGQAGAADADYSKANAFVAEAVKAYPDRLIGYARINPNYGADAVAALERCFDEYGFRGFTFDPEWEHVDPRDQTLVYPLVQAAAERGLPVLVECSWSPISPASFWRLAEDFPKTPVILSHLGFRLQDDAVHLASRVPNIYLETSDHMYFLGHVAEAIGADRLLFGSNAPFSVPEAELLKVTMRNDLSDEDKALILGGNAARLHPLV
jgi:predicted TIM-barrel fold metal-dependent hydrolase